MTPMILMYDLSPWMMQEIAELGYSCKKISKKRYLQPIGCHAGLPGYENTAEWYEGQELPDPVIVFVGFPDSLLNRFLMEYRKKQLPALTYRAILTETNKDWNILELFDELKQEHAALHMQRGQ